MPYDSTYMWNLKYNANELICEIETYSQTQKTNLWLPKQKAWERRDKLGGQDEYIHTTI